MAVLKVVELVGMSQDGWEDAVQQVFREASDSLRRIHGVQVIRQSTRLNDRREREYLATCRVAFELADGGRTATDSLVSRKLPVQASA